MKQYRLMHMLLLVAMLLAGVSCTNDLSEELQTPVTPLDGLAIGFDTGSKFTRVDVPSEPTLREDLVDHVDVFIFDGTTGTLVNGCYWHKTAAEMEENQTRTETLLDGEWKTSPLSGTDYDVYVVANLHSSSGLSDVQSVADLQGIIERDADIYKVNNETGSPGKLFTMSGKVEGFNPQTVDDEYILPVTLKRVAAKIEIHLAFDPEFAEKYEPTNVLQRLLNYGTSAYALEGQDDIYAAERASMDVEEEAYQYDDSKNEATLVLYTYPTEWETDVMQETFVVVNVPVVNKDVQEGEDATYNSNYYKIPLRSVTDAKRLERNHLYRVNATIDMLGNYTPDTPVELKKVEYAVQDWENVWIDIDGGNPHYLSVSEEVIIMKDIEDYNEILKFTSSDKVTCTITEAYYYDAEGTKQDVSRQIRNDITVTPDEGLSGFIDIHSPLPTNNGIRYIKFTVSNGYDTKDVLVKQYPLEYITFVDGWFSYRDDFKRRDSRPTTYLYQGDNVVSNGTFQSKVWEDNRIRTYEWGWRGVETSSYSAGTHNNKMYHVVITKTSDQYTLSVPIKDENGDTDDQDPANTNNVSPSFMLASRLGLVSADDYAFAKEHCRNYVETVRDGNTDRVLYTYDDWRLPTKAELMIIDRFQNTEGSVIITILNKSERGMWGGGSNAYYWGAGGRYRTNYDGTTTTTDEQWDTTTSGWDAGSAFIRCIRDVKPDEPINSEPEE